MSAGMQPHEGKITAALHLTNLLAVAAKLQILWLGPIISFLTWPWEGFNPCLVPEPIADEIGIPLLVVST